MPLSRPYGVTRPVDGQMFHVKHWLWRRWCFGRRRPRPPARLGDLASLGTASRSPPVPSGPSGALYAGDTWCAGVWPGQALPPPTAPPPVIQNAQPATESPVICGYVERYTFSTQKSRHFPPVSVSRPRAPQPGRANARRHRVRARGGMQKVRSPCGSADLRGTPLVPEFAQWRSAFTRCLASASSLS